MRNRLILGLCLLAACGRAEAVADRPWALPADRVDSILPMPEYLRRFREGAPKVDRLGGGRGGRDALAGAVLEGIARGDTAALLGLLVSRAEFGWLVFPGHLYARPPYELDPAIFWMQLRAESAKGLGRIVNRYGGRPLVMEGLACSRDTLQLALEGGTLWSGCRVRFRVGGRSETRQLFGSIVERDGRAKLLSYASDF